MTTAKNKRRPILPLLLVLIAVLLVVSLFSGGDDPSTESIPLAGGTGSLLERLRTDQALIEQVEIDGERVALTYNDGRRFKSRAPEGSDFLELLAREGIDVSATEFPKLEVKGGGSNVLGTLVAFLPLLIFGGILIFFLRQRGAAGGALSFGKSKARLATADRPSVTFNDVAGVVEAKEELQEVVEFLQYPERFAALGARIPRGVLLVGPPGTGKTLLARAVAGEAAVPFFSISGSEFVEMFVGVGASRVRDLFAQATKSAPAIIFIDEIDAVGRQRGAGLGGGHDEREQTLNQILVAMDGFDSNTGVIVIAATNRPDVLDPALLRPGRFDRKVVLDAPDVKGRAAILAVHANGKPLAADVSLDEIAKQTPGFSGADLANLLNEAAILAARGQAQEISRAELEEAVDRVVAGPERKSRLLSGREREIVAYHEAGHALVAAMIPGHDPVHKVTIVPRGAAGGYTRYLPEDERRLAAKSYYEGFLASALAGHAAEELVFGEMTTGAHDDLAKATQIARSMVTQWGMSARLGPRTFGRKESLVFLGRDISETRDYSERIAEQIDDEVREFIDRARDRARAILSANRDRLDRLAARLGEIETLEGDELQALLSGAGDRPGSAQPPTALPSNADRAPKPIMPPMPGLALGRSAITPEDPSTGP